MVDQDNQAFGWILQAVGKAQYHKGVQIARLESSPANERAPTKEAFGRDCSVE